MEVIESSLLHIDHCIENMTDINRLSKKFQENKFIYIDNFISSEWVKNNFCTEIENCTPSIHRVKIKTFKQSGSTSSQLLEKHAPSIFSLYHLACFKKLIETIVGVPLQRCPSDDLHSVALYHYTEPGDYIGVHYDKSFYRGKRYTVLLGLIQDSVSSKLVCYPGSSKLNRRKNPIEIYTHPGTLVIFDGDALWHEVTPLAENERRVILTMEFVTDTRMTVVNRWVSKLKDKLLYFGK
ncbi:MAG: 2OG-Fe(II) oxygenase [Gammaproteobacteria bacterium]|nr:2OG-Fe(II) oxygenase [Gammaproteobacteria bacterium]